MDYTRLHICDFLDLYEKEFLKTSPGRRLETFYPAYPLSRAKEHPLTTMLVERMEASLVPVHARPIRYYGKLTKAIKSHNWGAYKNTYLKIRGFTHANLISEFLMSSARASRSKPHIQKHHQKLDAIRSEIIRRCS